MRWSSYLVPAAAKVFWRRSGTEHHDSVDEHGEKIGDEHGGEAEEHGGEHEEHEQIVMLFFFAALLIGCLARFSLELLRTKCGVRIPYSVVLLIVGGLLGYATWEEVDQGGGQSDELFTQSLSIWSKINPHLLLFIFLPALIYESASDTNFYAFSKHFGSAMMLAVPGMCLQSFLIACVGRYVLPWSWGWTESLLFGGIMSATDPVAVVALLKELGVLPDLRVLIEAESLLNDGTAIVLFQLCIRILTEPASVREYIEQGFRLMLGAPALGLAMFIGSYYWLKATSDPIEETMVTVCTAYLAFFAAEGTEIETSGVLTVVTIGVLMAGWGYTAIDTEHARHQLHAVWSVITYCADTTIFVLAGAIIVETSIRLGHVLEGRDWGLVLALYLLLTVIRGLVVAVFSPYFRAFGYGLQPRVCSMSKFLKSMFIVTWGGLRGAVGLALALAVATDDALRSAVKDEKYNDRVLLLTAGMVVLTTLVNALLMEKVIAWLGLGGESQSQLKLFRGAVSYLGEQNEALIEKLQNSHENPEFSAVDWDLLRHCVGTETLVGEKSHIWDEVEEWEESARPLGAKTIRAKSIRGQNNADVGAQEAFSRDKAREEMREMVGRFLSSLRASYTSQWNRGLLAAQPYRHVRWAVDMALDHVHDADGSEDPTTAEHSKYFEWGWLKLCGYLEVPAWIRWVKCVPGLAATGWRYERYARLQHFELVSAVMRAHEETARVEFNYQDDVGCSLQQWVRDQSAEVLKLAKRSLDQMENDDCDNKKMTCTVRTRQAACVVLEHFEHNLENLQQIAQITDAEYDVLHHTLSSRLRKYQREYPRWPKSANKLGYFSSSLPVFRHIPNSDLNAAVEELSPEELSFAEGQDVYLPGAPFDRVFIVLKGVLQWSIHARPSDDPTLAHWHDMEPGTLFGDVELLLAHAGFAPDLLAKNPARARAKTSVIAYGIRIDKLCKLADRYPKIIQTQWRHSGRLLLRRCGEFMEEACAGEAGTCPLLAFPSAVLLPEGEVPGKNPALLIRGSATLDDGRLLSCPPLVHLSSSQAHRVKPSPPAGATPPLFLIFPPPKMSIVRRRNAELVPDSMLVRLASANDLHDELPPAQRMRPLTERDDKVWNVDGDETTAVQRGAHHTENTPSEQLLPNPVRETGVVAAVVSSQSPAMDFAVEGLQVEGQQHDVVNPASLQAELGFGAAT